MEDLLFERLDRMASNIEPEVVLQDLYFVDRVARPLVGPDERDYRVPYLVEALEARGFFSDEDEGWAAVELYDDLCDLCEVGSYAELTEVIQRFQAYRSARNTTKVEDS